MKPMNDQTIENPAETELKPLRAYIVYGGSREWYNATLVFENGWPAFGHIYSHPAYMRGDLIENRKERKAILAQMGYRVEIVGDPIAGSDKSPPELLAAYRNEAGWRAMADEYNRLQEAAKGAQ